MSTNKNKPKIIVILGPTASGKSDLAVKIALRLSSGQAQKLFGINGAEIISADSRQIYKNLDIGSGKITKKEMKGVPHHLLDVASPKKTFTVAQYQKLAKAVTKKIIKKNKIPIICGGTGFYIDSLIYDYQLPIVPPQPKLRKQLEKKSAEELFKQLKKLDPRRAKNIDGHNKRRLIRALEIILMTKKPVAVLRKSQDKKTSYDFLKIGIKKSPEELKKLIAERLKKRFKQGLIKEVKDLYRIGISWQRLDDLGLEYRYISRYLRNLISKEEMIKTLEKEIRRYAKRQMTWFKRDKEIGWIKNQKQAEKLVKKFMRAK